MRQHDQSGQALLLVVTAVGLFLAGAMGLAVDSGRLYFTRQMAQAAADAGATAAILSIYQGTDVVANPGYFATSSGSTGFTCSGNTTMIPCKYVFEHGFGGGNTSDTVTVSFPTTAPGYGGTLSTKDPVNQVKVLVTRNVDNSFMRLIPGVGATALSGATAIAAIVEVAAPIPIIVIHPTLPNALSMNGTTTIEICGGPSRSIQVNSSSSTAYQSAGTINLSQAGPGTTTSSSCPTPHGNGADFGIVGGQTTVPGSINFGSLPGQYVQPDSPIQDPLLFVNPPDPTLLPTAPAAVAVTNTHGCDPTIDTHGCHLYSPGIYSSDIAIGPNDTALFTPGVYYLNNDRNFATKSNGVMRMCSDCVSTDPDIVDGMLVYIKHVSGSNAGLFTVGGGGDVKLQGTPLTKVVGGSTVLTKYAGILFFQDRTAPAATSPKAHDLGGGGCLSLAGTIYVTNTEATITASGGTHYQELDYHGNPCSSTFVQGEIITDVLALKGTSDLRMLLSSQSIIKTRQVALVQ